MDKTEQNKTEKCEEKENVIETKKEKSNNEKMKKEDVKLENKLSDMTVKSEETKDKETKGENPLGELSTNQDQQVDQDGKPICSFCGKQNPTKRCVKRHPKCLRKLFCNETCETLAHKKSADSKTVAKKKPEAGKKKKGKKGDKPSGEFWWNNTVYASW